MSQTSATSQRQVSDCKRTTTAESVRAEVVRALREHGTPIATRFTKHFRRPALFRFAFASPHPYPPLAHIVSKHVCGADKLGAYAWTKHHEKPARIESADNVSMVVAGATCISVGSAHTIAALLMPEVGGSGLGQVSTAAFLGEESFEGAECIVIGAPHPAGGEFSLSLERDTLILRKLRTKLGAFPPSDEIRRSIRIDQEVHDSVFERPSIER